MKAMADAWQQAFEAPTEAFRAWGWGKNSWMPWQPLCLSRKLLSISKGLLNSKTVTAHGSYQMKDCLQACFGLQDGAGFGAFSGSDIAARRKDSVKLPGRQQSTITRRLYLA